MSEQVPCLATEAELKELRRKCWWSDCNKTALFEDWGGWRWCPYHAYYTIRWGGGNIWFGIKKLKFYWKGLL